MSKKSSPDPKIQVTEYRLAIHFGVCHGPVGAVRTIFIGEKVAWQGPRRASGPETIDRQELFGGLKKEGGVKGVVRFLFGEVTQTLPDAIANGFQSGLTGETAPGFRGLLTMFFSAVGGVGGFMWGANTPYIKNVWFEIEDLPGIDGMQWYPETAPIPRDTDTVPGVTREGIGG